MHIADLISPERVVCCQESSSKKRTLEQLSQILANSTPNITAGEIFDSLNGRERFKPSIAHHLFGASGPESIPLK